MGRKQGLCKRNFSMSPALLLLGRRLGKSCSVSLRGLHRKLVGQFLKHSSSQVTRSLPPGRMARPGQGDVGPRKHMTEVSRA